MVWDRRSAVVHRHSLHVRHRFGAADPGPVIRRALLDIWAVKSSILNDVSNRDLGCAGARSILRFRDGLLATLPMSVILQQEGFTLGSIKRQVAAKLPGTLASQHLGIPVHAAILFYTFVLTDGSDAPLEWVQIMLHPNESPPLEVFDLRTGTVRVTDVL